MNQQQAVAIAKVVSLAVVQALMSLPTTTQQPKAAKKATTKKPTASAIKTNDRKEAFRLAVIDTFKAKGLKVVPNVDVLTFGKWQALGFKPKTGEKATFVKTFDMNGNGIALFHKAQVEKIA